MINKTSLTAQHIVKIDVNKIVKYLSNQTQDVLKEELHSDDLNDIDVCIGCGCSELSLRNLNTDDCYVCFKTLSEV